MKGLLKTDAVAAIVSTASAGAELKMCRGSFYSINSRAAHVSVCGSVGPCSADLYQDQTFDFLTVQQ